MKREILRLGAVLLVMGVLCGCAGRRFAMDAAFEEDTLTPKTSGQTSTV